MRPRVVLLALAVALAGCSLPGVPGTVAPPEDVDTPDTAPSTPTVDPDNPWREAELAVAIRTQSGDDRDYRPLVDEALSYWTDNAEQYAGYPVSFRQVEAAEAADLVVSFVPSVGNCGNTTDVAGCAPVPEVGASLERPQTVEVGMGLSDESTVTVLEHEFGHALGLDHDDDPQPLMAPVANLTTLPQRDATERALPWKDPDLSVYVEYGNASDPEGAREQVGHALAYYTDGADGRVPENVTFVTTDDRTAADVVVQFRDDACDQDRGSCARRAGLDPDGDDALEYYTRVEITLAGIDTPATAWHVARWLGYAMGFEEDGDWPAPLRDADYEERRSEWWE